MIRGPNGLVHYAGLQTCGALWLCPVCAAKIGGSRAEEVTTALTRHLAGGFTAAMQTFTVSHDLGDDLERLRRLAADGFRAVLAGSRWDRVRRQLGHRVWRTDKTGRRAGERREAWELGTIRALEVTHGRHGWHPHLHVLFFFDAEVTDAELGRFGRENAETWARVARAKMGKRALLELCPIERVRDDRVGEYVAKFASELTRADLKTTGTTKDRHYRGRHPFEILERYLDTEDRRELLRWHQWENGIKGARALTWSRGLKLRFNVTEQTDDELAAEEVGGEELLVLTGEDWRRVRSRASADVELQEVAERGGRPAAEAFLAALRQLGRAPP